MAPGYANGWMMLGRSQLQHRMAIPAVGSPKRELEPGRFVLCDQYVDRTNGRTDTFFLGPNVIHVSAVDPYCPDMTPHPETVLARELAMCCVNVFPFQTMTLVSVMPILP